MDIKLEKYVIGVDIGGTHTRIGAVTPEGNLEHFIKRKTTDVIESNNPIKSLRRFLSAYIEEFTQGHHVLAIGLGFPSVVSKDKKKIYTTTSMESLANVNIVDPLEKELKLPVYMDNDVNNLLKYELAKRPSFKDETILGFYIGTGFGNSIFVHGQFLEGKNGAAAELGHMPIFANKDVCDCGNIGCAEVIASGKRLVALHSKHFNDHAFEKIFTIYADHPIINDYIRALSVPIATEINIFDPDLVVIGGGVVGMTDFPKQKLEKYIIASCRKPYPAEGLVIEYADDVNAAGVLGAASFIYEQLGEIDQ